ncbi:hypothetical protein ACHAXT_009741 [Thalassiosira profunda]
MKMSGAMSELHIAVTLDQPAVVRSILAQRLCNVHQIDNKGDQAAHIAARLNHVECFKVLVEYDARMGRKNFSGLTPLGEAQMAGNKEIVALINTNYTSPSREPCAWDEEVANETAAWYEVWDDEEQRMQWARPRPDGTVELSDTPPPMEVQRVIAARDQYGERNRIRRIHPKSLPSMRQVEHEQQRQRDKEKLELVLKNRARVVEHRCAVKVQAHFRRVRARLQAKQRKREQVAANRMQRRFRFHMRRKRNQAAMKLQSVARMASVKRDYDSFLHERLWWLRASRQVACHAQRLWRGFLARSEHRQLHAMEILLPDPTDHRNFDVWKRLQSEAHPPKKELGVYAQYTLGGTPRSWPERALKRSGMFRDVTFYANTITKRATWTKPNGWLFKDHREYYVLRVQTCWRARRARRKIRLYARAKMLLENAHSQDMENTDPDIAVLANYTLYVHSVLHDYDRARGLYSQLNDFMQRRGVDNAFVLYSYAIFEAATGEEDWADIKDYARRAREADERMQKREHSAADTRDPPKCAYTIATAAFYLQSICSEHDPAESHHNYALCQMLVLGDLDGARESFLQAMKCSPRDTRIIANFNTLLQDPDYLGDPASNAHELFLVH